MKTDELKNKSKKSYKVALPAEGTRYANITKGKRNTEMVDRL